MIDYATFLASKAIIDKPSGFRVRSLPAWLFDFQADCVRWGLKRGRAAFFEDCGLGKTGQAHSWAEQVVKWTNGAVLIVTPLCVAQQHVREGAKFGIEVKYVKCQEEVTGPGIYVTNYEKLHRFSPGEFTGIVLDESSILKAYDGKTRKAVTAFGKKIPYRSCFTATPSPNDYAELGNHAEFLGVMSQTEMLATFFIHDGGDTSKWRLKRHAEKAFWKWVASWAVNIRKPSDLGYDDGDFTLPPLNTIEHIVETDAHIDGYLFALPASTLDERRKARRASLHDRVNKCAEIITAQPDDQWVAWGDLNDECTDLAKLIDAEEIAGKTSEEERERITAGFLDGTIKRVVTKPSIWGFGLNLQCCHNTALIGMSDSYERYYQLIRRFWRFGQKLPVNVHIAISRLEGAVLENVKRKEVDAQRMADEMVQYMADLSKSEIKNCARETESYQPTVNIDIPNWLCAS